MSIKVVAQNRKAKFDYFIIETYEAGIVLSGTEVKSVRQSKVSIKDSHAILKDSEIFIMNMHINNYEQGNIHNKDPLRTRKLLLHKSEINKLIGQTQLKGLAIVPMEVYFKRNRVKIKLAVGKGKKLHDKRQDIAKRDAQRQIDSRLKESQRT